MSRQTIVGIVMAMPTLARAVGAFDSAPQARRPVWRVRYWPASQSQREVSSTCPFRSWLCEPVSAMIASALVPVFLLIEKSVSPVRTV